jgi:hypothetical protein
MVTLYRFDVMTGNIQPLDHFADVIPPKIHWSPDGRYAAYAAPIEDSDHFMPVIADMETGSVKRLDNLRIAMGDGVSWSADGTQLLIAGQQDDNTQLFLYDTISQILTALLQPAPEAINARFGAIWLCPSSER